MRVFGNAIKQLYAQLTINPPVSGGAPLTVLQSGGTAATTFSNAGNVTIAAPASGLPLTVLSNGTTCTQFDTSTAAVVCQLALARLGTGKAFIGVAGAAGNLIVGSSVDDLMFRTQGTNFLVSTNSGASTAFSINSSGNVTIAAPSSGVALTATGSGASLVLQVNGAGSASIAAFDSTSVGGGYFAYSESSVARGYIGGAGALVASGTTGDFALRATSGLNVATGGTTSRFTISSNGNVTINAPSSGTSLTITNSGASVPSLVVDSTNANGALQEFTNSGSIFGYIGSAKALLGGNLSDYAITSPNSLFLSATTVNVPNGTGTLSPVYAGIPQNLQGANYTFVLSDANKHIYQNAAGAHTWTIPSNASVAYPIGTAITLINTGGGAGNTTLNITTDTLVWSPSGSTGSRTLAPNAVATLIKVSATIWYISGSGLT